MAFDQLNFEKPNSFWKNVLWLDKMKVEHFGYNPTHHVWSKDGCAYDNKKISNSHSNAQVELSWLGVGSIPVVVAEVGGITYMTEGNMNFSNITEDFKS